jgi:hypothetical protein
MKKILILATSFLLFCFTPHAQVKVIGPSIVMGPGGGGSCTAGGVFYANCLANVPFCTGFAPVAGQTVTFSTTGTPNPCWAAVGGINLYVNGTLVASGLTGVSVNGH